MKRNLYEVPRNKQVRVIIDTDAGAEADDQYAIVHALMTPKFDVVGIVAEQFRDETEGNSMIKSYDEIKNVLNKMGLEKDIPVFLGERNALNDNNKSELSEGGKFIIEEALKKDNRPLFVLNMGAITNLAAAYLSNPSIEDYLIAIWIGGGTYPIGHMDFNLANDVRAANIMMESKIELWQIPLGTYTKMAVSFSELFEKVEPCGEIGKYLVEHMLKVNEKECSSDMSEIDIFGNMSKGEKTVFIRSGEGWSLGDSPAVGVLITPQGQNVEKRKAQRFNSDGTYGDYIRDDREIRVYHNLDSRVILEDFFAKIKYYYSDEKV